MMDDWLTIPFAPNYEINSDLQVRNKKTGRILKANYRQSKAGQVVLKVGGKHYLRTANVLRDSAMTNIEQSNWIAVPSLNYLYEVNAQGCLRSTNTKRKLKLMNNVQLDSNKLGSYNVSIEGKARSVSVRTLLQECHGENLNKLTAKVKCSAMKDHDIIESNSLNDLARILAPRIFYSPKTVANFLSKRQPFIEGYQINYVDIT